MDLIFPRRVDRPRPGWFRLRQYRRGPWIPATIWLDKTVEDRPPVLLAAVMDEPADVDTVWEFGRECTRDEWELLWATMLWRLAHGWMLQQEDALNINELYPSKYLKSADLHNKTAQLVIARIEVEVVDTKKGEKKPVLYFKTRAGKPIDRGMVLNKTNANNLSFMFGTDTDDWIGKAVEMFPTSVEFQGNMVMALRLRPIGMNTPKLTEQPMAAPWKPVGNTSTVQQVVDVPSDLDDDIPF